MRTVLPVEKFVVYCLDTHRFLKLYEDSKIVLGWAESLEDALPVTLKEASAVICDECYDRCDDHIPKHYFEIVAVMPDKEDINAD